eukprot:scaffold43917_cov27-Tisochrysis_lutea.AAC.1
MRLPFVDVASPLAIPSGVCTLGVSTCLGAQSRQVVWGFSFRPSVPHDGAGQQRGECYRQRPTDNRIGSRQIECDRG